jgi:integrase
VRIKITEKNATSLRWSGNDAKPYIAWDDVLKGFGVSVWGAGSSKAYVVQAKHRGRSFRQTLGTVGEMTAAEARERAIAFKGAVKDGRDPRAELNAQRAVWTLDDAMDHFLGDYAAARKLSDGHKTNFTTAYKHHTPNKWKNLPLSEITQAMIVSRHREITGGILIKGTQVRGGSRRANEWLALMSRLFSLGANHGCPTNPVTGIKKNEETHRDRFLTPSELRTLWRYLDEHSNVEAAVCVQFILLTGCRPGEAFTMRWADLNQSTGVWRKPSTKTKQRKAHVVQLSQKAVAILGRLDTATRSDYVFPAPEDATRPRSDKLKAFWRHVRKNCSLADVRLYDCRHSFASWLAMGGVSELAIAAQLGHSDPKTTRRYTHFSQEHQRRHANVMAETIAKALRDFEPDTEPLVAETKGNSTTFYGRTFVTDFDSPLENEIE